MCVDSDGGLGEGDPQVLVASHVVVVEVDQGLDGFLHGGHLQEGHLVVPGGGSQHVTGSTSLLACSKPR